MSNKFIPVNIPKLYNSEKTNVINCVRTNWISSEGKFVKEFEKKFSQYNSRKFGVAVSSGTAALEVAIKSLNLKKNSEVIIPSFSIIATALCVVKCGLKPILVDCSLSTWNMDPEKVLKKISKKTSAIIITHIYGLPVDLQKIMNVAKKKNIKIIEDAAEVIGLKYKNRMCGSFGDVSTFSFYANKHITTGEGGAILSDNSEFIKKGRQLINLDFNNTERFKHNNLYWNHRISGLQAALGISQINGLEKVIKKKINQGRIYEKLLEDYKDIISIQPSTFKGVDNHYWVFGILLKKEGIRDKLIKELLNEGIETRPFFWPLHLQSALPKKFFQKDLKLESSENLGRNGLYIPIGNHISEADQRRIIKVLLNKIK